MDNQRNTERQPQSEEENAKSDVNVLENSCSGVVRSFPLPFIRREGATAAGSTSFSHALLVSGSKNRSQSETCSSDSSGAERTSGQITLLQTGDIGSDCSLSEDFQTSTTGHTERLRLCAPLRKRDSETTKDPRITRKCLLNAFPVSLKHIAVDEVAAAGMKPGDTVIAATSGYHHQFTEQTLLEIHGLLLRTAAAAEARKQYLMAGAHMEATSVGRRVTEGLIEGESARDLTVWSEGWYRHHPSVRGGVLTAVTVRPPQFKAGMLWNGEDKFLLGGTAFVEEARILQVKVPHSQNFLQMVSNSTTLCTEGSRVTKDQWTESCDGSDARSEPKKVAHLLVREYSSISKVRGGTMVQTFSLIPDHVQGNTQRSLILQRGQITKVLSECAPGAVTRGFSLQLLLPSSLRSELGSMAYENPFSTRDTDSNILDDGGGECGTFCANESTFANTMNSDFMSSTATLMMNRTSKVRTTVRQPLGDETYLRFANPKLYAFVMQQSPAILTAHTNAIREYILYHHRFRIRRKIAEVMQAIRALQGFFRHCLGRKKRAIKRMLRQWRRLEYQCRARLKKQTFEAPNVSRISYVVGSVLWEHVVTTDEYKLNMLEEQMKARRAGYLRWCAQRREENRMMPKVNESSESTEVRGIGDPRGASTVLSPKELSTGTMLVSREQPRLDSTLNKSHHRWIAKWRDVVHARFGWYIEPEVLLRESHRRLLHSLRNTILTMADVQAALKKRGEEDEFTLM
ncbi:hypothetical protein, conserved [Trypanosoma brucei brucei TREU927]|uniref:Uncharacterized protein n=1 Tax=Trypanosoma brucei brucei (strain 927/4 GUTat10.1) TaxID=185431 RepID=Q389I6_TRYB2|nr:hypothetical protein, conserved [Trypanosoma brucei brucei TREU927]EAN78534.1 hypothetical protein, conserved [Trypanosoma brucei brucei TREU927]